jgi:hypothetical protein
MPCDTKLSMVASFRAYWTMPLGRSQCDTLLCDFKLIQFQI